MTFINRMQQTVWVAASPDASHPMARTGWVLRPGDRVTVIVPNHWNGRFWGRTGCVFHGGRGHCQTGDCAGRFQCKGWGTIPATLAEYDLDAWDNLDFYDVSMVDGSNLPMYINPTTGARDQEGQPARLRPGRLHHGRALPERARRSTCTRQVRRAASRPAPSSAATSTAAAASGRRGRSATRRKWPVDYARVFKRAEPYAYSYVDDDATSVYVCSGRCDYHIVFGL